MTPLESNVQEVLEPLLGVTTILMDQNKPRPKLPYAAFKVKSQHAVHEDHYSDVDDDGVITVRGHREGTLSVQFYGRSAIETLQVLHDRLRLPSVMGAFSVRGLAAFNASAVTDISVTRETQVEERANLDIFIRYVSVLEDDVGIIEHADVTGVIDSVSVHVVA